MDISTQIAQQLEEPAEFLIRKVVRVIGEETAADFLEQTLTLVANGYEDANRDSALRRRDGQPRTPGGTFFYLVRGGISPEQRRQLWPPRRKRPLLVCQVIVLPK